MLKLPGQNQNMAPQAKSGLLEGGSAFLFPIGSNPGRACGVFSFLKGVRHG